MNAAISCSQHILCIVLRNGNRFMLHGTMLLIIYPIGWRSQNGPPTSFSPVTSTKVRLSSQNFLTFSFNLFVTLVQTFKAIPIVSSKLLSLNQDYPSKKVFFWSNPYKIEVMITSLIEMLELPNFGRMITSAI